MVFFAAGCQFQIHENGFEWEILDYKDGIDLRTITGSLSPKEAEEIDLDEKTRGVIQKYKEIYPLEFSFGLSLLMVLIVLASKSRKLLKLFFFSSFFLLAALLIAYYRESGWKLYFYYYSYWESGYDTFVKYLFGSLKESIKLEVTVALNVCLFNVLMSLLVFVVSFHHTTNDLDF